MAVDYSKTPRVSQVRVDYSRPDRPRIVVVPDADNVIRLRRGESTVLR